MPARSGRAPKPENFDRSVARFSYFGVLIICVLIDLIGCMSYIFPLMEFTDIAWAPVSSYLIFSLTGNVYGSVINLIEESMPGLDIIPTATIMFFVCAFQKQKKKHNYGKDKKDDDCSGSDSGSNSD